MIAKILNGNKIADKIKKQLKQKIYKLNHKPGLAVILIGKDNASKIYTNNLEKLSQEIGFNFFKFLYYKNFSEDEILKRIKILNKDSQTNGIILQLPLPKNYKTDKIIKSIILEKDVEGLSQLNFKKIYNNEQAIIPPTIVAIFELIKKTDRKIKNKIVVIFGKNENFTKLLKFLLEKKDCIVKIVNLKTNNWQEEVHRADILISLIGKSKIIKSKMIKNNAIIIDVGINKMNNKIIGDVDFAKAKKIASWITPVPGGVGPITVIAALRNTYELYKKRN